MIHKIKTFITLIALFAVHMACAETIIVIGSDGKDLYLWTKLKTAGDIINEDCTANASEIKINGFRETGIQIPAVSLVIDEGSVKLTEQRDDIFLIFISGTSNEFTKSSEQFSSSEQNYLFSWKKLFKQESSDQLDIYDNSKRATIEFLKKQTYSGLMKKFENNEEEPEKNFLDSIDEDINYNPQTDTPKNTDIVGKTLAFVCNLFPSKRFLKNIGYGIFAGTASGFLGAAVETVGTNKKIHKKTCRYAGIGAGAAGNLLLTKNSRWSTHFSAIAAQAATHYLLNRYNICQKIIY